ncbi:hypothetical protein SAMN04244581_01236 [Paracoccus denitrificans]|nr:hypothetical protein SAMN04244581_01236 [Paracoccus denitrificans]SFR02714.1 hypothetical protein SAMN04244569_01432 [Paracoccus denitrificans]
MPTPLVRWAACFRLFRARRKPGENDRSPDDQPDDGKERAEYQRAHRDVPQAPVHAAVDASQAEMLPVQKQGIDRHEKHGKDDAQNKAARHGKKQPSQDRHHRFPAMARRHRSSGLMRIIPGRLIGASLYLSPSHRDLTRLHPPGGMEAGRVKTRPSVRCRQKSLSARVANVLDRGAGHRPGCRIDHQHSRTCRKGADRDRHGQGIPRCSWRR